MVVYVNAYITRLLSEIVNSGRVSGSLRFDACMRDNLGKKK